MNARAPKGYFPGEFAFIVGSKKTDIKYKATGEFRAPKRGEFYLSGAIVAAYKAPNDLNSEYWIAAPVQMETCKCCDGTGKTEKK
jgi:hypothetical protein